MNLSCTELDSLVDKKVISLDDDKESGIVRCKDIGLPRLDAAATGCN